METQQAKAPASNSSRIASVSRATVHSLIKIVKLDPIFFPFGLFSSDGFFIADPECLFLLTKMIIFYLGMPISKTRSVQFSPVFIAILHIPHSTARKKLTHGKGTH